MCGICGIVTLDGPAHEYRPQLESMVASLRHRGPDDKGVWLHEQVGLGHARLSILDLSEHGRQPMLSPDGEWSLVFNGEVYNFLELRCELEERGFTFRGGSDTEVIVAALCAWGFDGTLKRLRGMFALAAWHEPSKKLFLGRDRLGQKPLYYGRLGSFFVFGSELRVLRSLPVQPTLSQEAAALMLRYKCVPAPLTIYQEVQKLPPASRVVFDLAAASAEEPIRYWYPAVGSVRKEPLSLPELVESLTEAVRLRMISDVPLGAFLSGGVDSSLVVALMQSISSEPVRTFTAGFEHAHYNEANQAAEVARHLGTDHTELMVTEREALDLVPRLGELYDEPFGDSSQVPTTLLSHLTRRHVTVALSGDGGDELFKGYNRNVWLPRLHAAFTRLPGFFRTGLSELLLRPELYRSAEWLDKSGWVSTRLLSDKLRKFARLLGAGSFSDRYRVLLSDWDETPVKGADFDRVDEFAEVATESTPYPQQLTLADYLFYLPNDVLAKVDRASMSASLEVRSPFLDHKVIDRWAGVPEHWNVTSREGKVLLRRVLAEFVPTELFSRAKMGFAAPIGYWLRGSLKEWAEATLRQKSATYDELLNREQILLAWEDLLSDRTNNASLIWNVLMLLTWLDAQKDL